MAVYTKKRFIPNKIKRWIRSTSFEVLKFFVPEIINLKRNINWKDIESTDIDTKDQKIKLYTPYKINSSKIGAYTYIATNSRVSMTTIGRFCSIGPNFVCGWGIHPTNGISTSPMFYSTLKQNGTSLCYVNKIEERNLIKIGNDVFIGSNVTILDGITIGDGAVIGAGAVVSKDIPPYAVAVGVPIRIIKFRFNDDQISKLLKIKWWDFDDEKLKDVEHFFFEVDQFIKKYFNPPC